MASEDHSSPLKSKKTSTASSRSRNELDNQWLLLPNNLELGARTKPSKKLRNKEKLGQYQKKKYCSPDVTDSLSTKSETFQNFPPLKCNTSAWLKDQYSNDEKRKKQTQNSEEVVFDTDSIHPYQQNVNYPPNSLFSDVEHQDPGSLSRYFFENENIKSVEDELKKKEAAIFHETLSHIQEFISEAESSWQKLDVSDEQASENGLANSVSPSSSTSKVSNSEENINLPHLNGEEHSKYNHIHKKEVVEKRGQAASSIDSSIIDIPGRISVVEWERRKLKNKLVELQEEKKIKDELFQALCYLKDAANTISADVEYNQPKVKKKRQNRSSIVKRDNFQKDQNSAFPARRHYEAEGRANEDPDVPSAPAPVLSPSIDTPEMHDKLAKLRVAQEHVKIIKDIIVSILQSKKPGIPLDKLDLFATVHHSDQYSSSEESHEESDADKEFTGAVHKSTLDPVCTNVKEASVLDIYSQKHERSLQSTANLDSDLKKSELAKLKSQFKQLMQIYPPSGIKNDDPVRSGGEGAYTQKKNSNFLPENVKKFKLKTLSAQDNSHLTQQNISMEAQHQNSNNLHIRDCNSVKKDNINNLSIKTGKLSIQDAMHSSFPDVGSMSNNNIDSMSTLSYELNQNHAIQNAVERKTILDILKQDKKKQKQYDQNWDKMYCNSCIESEPLEGSNFALAAGTTPLAAWGSSVTQDNFKHETEDHGGCLQQQGCQGATLPAFEEERKVNHGNQNMSVLQSYPHFPTQCCKLSQQLATSNTEVHSQSVLENPHLALNSDHCEQEQGQPKFYQQMKSHIDQLNVLCQSQAYFDQSHHLLNFQQYQNSQYPNHSRSFQSAAELAQPGNQQLLLNLSQCYHALYLQQLEIQYLQRCMYRNMDTENVHPPLNSLNPRNNRVEQGYQAGEAPSMNPLISPSYFSCGVNMPEIHTAPYYSPSNLNKFCGPVSEMHLPQDVTHSASQNNVSQETLNNQVPPRTRANNFWDNFRSYSRQNLLSTSNNKRNESIDSLITPQMRHVYPLVTNENQNSILEMNNASFNTASFMEDARIPANTHLHEQMNFPKKYKPICSMSEMSANHRLKKKAESPSYATSAFQNSQLNRLQLSTVEPIVLHTISNATSGPNLLPENSIENESKNHKDIHELPAANAVNDLSKVIPEQTISNFLIELLHEAQCLQSDALREKALKIIRYLAVTENKDERIDIQDDQRHSTNQTASVPSTTNSSFQQLFHSENKESEVNLKERTIKLTEMASGNSQTLSTATILPLNKHEIPSCVATGAVKKVTKVPATSLLETAANDDISNDSGSSTVEIFDPPTVISLSKQIDDIPEFITENVVSDLQSKLSSLKRRLLRNESYDAFWTSIDDCLFHSITTHFISCSIKLTHKLLLQLKQTVEAFSSLFSGIPLETFESDFLFYVQQFVYEKISFFMANGQFIDPSAGSLSSKVEKFVSWVIWTKMSETNPKVSFNNSDQMQELSIKMPSEEIGAFSQYPSSEQNICLASLHSFDNFNVEGTLETSFISAPNDDFTFKCNLKAEVEPEVEIEQEHGTEADLAEADQSPGQQGTVGDCLPSTESWSVDQETIFNRNLPNNNAPMQILEHKWELEDSSGAAVASENLKKNHRF